MTIQEFGAKLRARTITSEDIVERLPRADRRRAIRATNAFILVTADEARRQAREADRELAEGHDRGPLHGVPLSIKDLMDVRGHRDDRRVARPRGPHRARTMRRASPPAGGRRGLRRQDQPARVRARHHERRLGVRSRAQSARHRRGRRAARAADRPSASPPAWRWPPSAPTRAARSGFPPACCGIVGLKPSLRRSVDRRRRPAVVDVRSRRPAGASVGRRVDGVPRADRRARAAAAGARAVVGASARRAASLLLRHAGRRRARAVRGSAGQRFAPRASAVREIEIPHTETIANVYIHISLKEAARVSRGDARRRAGALHAAGSTAAGDGTDAASTKITCWRSAGREQLRSDVDAALADCDALVLPTLPIPAPKIGAEMVQVGTDEAAAAQRHAPPDAALQHHRPSGDLDPVRADARRACRAGSSSSAREARRNGSCRIALACERRYLA